MFVVSTAVVSGLAALLMWEAEHIRSVPLAVVIAAAALGVCGFVLRRMRIHIDELAAHFQTLLANGDEQSRRVEEANRLKDDFLGTLSHELRTPLNAVLGWSRLLQSGKLDADQTIRAVLAIERAGWTQARLIEDLLDISEIATGKVQLQLRPTDVEPLVHAVVESFRAAVDSKSLQLETAVDPRVGRMSIDPDRVRQMLWHLLSNAVKFTPAHGRIHVGAAYEGSHLRLWITDTGIGFEPGVAEELFQRFRQADSSPTRPYGGLGLGLGIVRHLTELHGGTVSARSAGPGHGASFEITLPITDLDEQGSGDVAAARPFRPLLHGVTVLVVDDDAPSLSLTKAGLEQFGARVLTASCTAEALDCLGRQRVQVLLSDLRMPGEDGLDLIRRVRACGYAPSQMPAAALTVLARTEDRRRALNAGYQVHVAKPADPVELASTVAWLTQADASGSVGAAVAQPATY